MGVLLCGLRFTVEKIALKYIFFDVLRSRGDRYLGGDDKEIYSGLRYIICNNIMYDIILISLFRREHEICCIITIIICFGVVRTCR